jgi:hypothetical protein
MSVLIRLGLHLKLVLFAVLRSQRPIGQRLRLAVSRLGFLRHIHDKLVGKAKNTRIHWLIVSKLQAWGCIIVEAGGGIVDGPST